MHLHVNVSEKHFLGRSCHNFWDKSRVGRFQRRVETLKIPQKRMSCQCQRSCLSWPYFLQISVVETVQKCSKVLRRYRRHYEIIWHILKTHSLGWTSCWTNFRTKKIEPQRWASLKDNLGPEHSSGRDLRPKFGSHSVWRMAFVMGWRTERMSSLPLGTLDAVPSVHVLGVIPSHAVHQSTCVHSVLHCFQIACSHAIEQGMQLLCWHKLEPKQERGVQYQTTPPAWH